MIQDRTLHGREMVQMERSFSTQLHGLIFQSLKFPFCPSQNQSSSLLSGMTGSLWLPLEAAVCQGQFSLVQLSR